MSSLCSEAVTMRLSALFAGHDRGAGVAALDHEFGRFHVQPTLGRGLVVAGDAVVFEEGMDLLVVVDHAGRGGGGKDEYGL